MCIRDRIRTTKYEVDILTATGAEVERLSITNTDAHRRITLQPATHLSHYILLGIVPAKGVERISLFRFIPKLGERQGAFFMWLNTNVSSALVYTTKKAPPDR